MNFYATKSFELVQSTTRGSRSYIHFVGVSLLQDFAAQITRVDFKNFIENIDLKKSYSSFRIVCLEEGKEEAIDEYGGIEVDIEIATHKTSKHSNIESTVVFSKENFENLQSKLLMFVDFEVEFEMPQITKVKFREEDEISVCEMKTSLSNYKFLKIKNSVNSN
jgi:hypothetical protein